MRTNLLLEELYELCGYSLRRVRGDSRASDPYADKIAFIQRDPRMSPDTKLAAIGTNTWRSLIFGIDRLPIPDKGKQRILARASKELNAAGFGSMTRWEQGKAADTPAQRSTAIEDRPTMIMPMLASAPRDGGDATMRDVESLPVAGEPR